MNKHLLILIMSLAISNFSFGQGETSLTNDSTTWNLVKNNTYELTYPNAWDFDSSKLMNTTFIVLSPLANAQDTFRENINFIIENLRGQDISLEQYTTITFKQMKKLMTNIAFYESGKIEGDSIRPTYQKVVYSSKQGVYNLKTQQRWWVQNGNAYVVTFSCQAKEYDNFEAIGEKILDSILIK